MKKYSINYSEISEKTSAGYFLAGGKKNKKGKLCDKGHVLRQKRQLTAVK